MKEFFLPIYAFLILITGIMFGFAITFMINFNSFPTIAQIRSRCYSHQGLSQIYSNPFGDDTFIICRDGYGTRP